MEEKEKENEEEEEEEEDKTVQETGNKMLERITKRVNDAGGR